MDNEKIGNLILRIRKEKKLTQKQLSEKLNVSDKAISKWERGQGCPDISSVIDLAEVLGVNVTEILSGEELINDNDSGNMKKTKFYVCSKCGNIITSTNNLIMSCCGSKLVTLEPKKEISSEADKLHCPVIEVDGGEIYVSLEHEMEKKHYISFIAYVTVDRLYMNKLYPEQSCEVRFKRNGHGILYLYCSQHGLWMKYI